MAQKECGYAWFVVFYSFLLHFITDGCACAYSFGIFFSELLTEFKITNASGAWVPSIMTGLTFGVGPLASALVNKFGCKLISITGTTLVAIGFFLSTFATTVITLYFTIGILAGVGFGLIYLPAIVIITQWFTKRLALATGLAVSASGIGSALFAPFTEYLIRNFGWRVAMQAVSFILFASGLCGLSFKNFEEDLSSDSEEDEYTSDDNYKDEISKQKMVKFSKDDPCNIEQEKLMKNENSEHLDKLCNNGNALNNNNKIQLSQSSLTSVTSDDKHNRIINSHLNKQSTMDKNLDDGELDNGESDEMQTEQEMLIPKEDSKSEEEDQFNNNINNLHDDKNNSNKLDEAHSDENKLKDDSNLNSTTNLFNNLTTSLNTNLNNLNKVQSRPNEIPRLSLDSSANYKLQRQLQQHHQLQQLKENQSPNNQLNMTGTSIVVDKANLNSDNNPTTDQNNLNESHGNLTEQTQPNTTQYKSVDSLNQIFNLPISTMPISTGKIQNSNCNLNTIVLYSTSMTSINYCTAGAPDDREVKSSETVNSKHNNSMLGSQKLINVLSVPLNLENFGIEQSHSQLISKKHSKPDKLQCYELKRRLTLENLGRYLNLLLSWNLLRDRIFLWFAISNFLTSLGYYVPYIYIKELCTMLPGNTPKLSSNCSYLLSIIGISSTIGRILFGFISDFQKCNRIYIYAHCLTLCGLTTILSIFADTYYLLAIYSCMFGLTTGAFVSLTTVIVVDLLGPNRVSNAFGLLLLFQGVATLTGPPIVGLFYDYTSSYHAGFLIIGIFIVISGSMLYLIPFLKKFNK